MKIKNTIDFIWDVFKKSGNLEAQKRIMELQKYTTDLEGENLDLKKQVAEGEEKLKIFENLKFSEGGYWLPGGVTKGVRGPFCQRCFDVDNNRVLLLDEGYTYYLCKECDRRYSRNI